MPVKTYSITDPDSRSHLPSIAFDSAKLGIEDCSVVVETLHGGVGEGVQMITVTTPKCRFVVLPTRGMSIWKAWAGAGDSSPYGWNSPVRGPVHPSFVPLMEPSGLGWLDGFDEMFVRCGLESNGAPDFDAGGKLVASLHGRIANKPARKVWIEANSATGEISVVGEVVEARFHFLKLQLTARAAIKSGTTEIRIDDEVKNLSASPAEFQMLYHINFGDPLLDDGSQFVAPVKQIVPRDPHAASLLDKWSQYPGPAAGAEEQVYFLKMLGDDEGNSQTLLKNASSTAGVNLHFNIKQLPAFSLWKNPIGIEDGYVTGLEPGTNFPNPRSFEGEQGRVVTLDGGAIYKMALRIDMLDSARRVANAENAVAGIRGDHEPEVFDTPQPGWCSDA